MIQVAVEHRSTYEFDRPVRLAPHVVRLRPAPHCRTPVLAYSLKVEAPGHFINWQQDPFGNHLARLVFPDPVDRLDITVDLIADMTVVNPFDFFLDEDARTYPFAYDAALARDLGPYREVGDSGPLLADLVAGERHVPLACTPDPRSAAPIEGATEVADVTFTYSNVVGRVFEDPRVTLPYTEEQWAAIDALGRAVDDDLAAGDVRLTMGGEPTFVSVDDMAGDEWNTAPVGPTKYGLALDLTRRLVD